MRIGLSTSVIQGGRSGIGQYVFALTAALLENTDHEYTLFVLEKDRELFRFAQGRAQLSILSERFRPPVRDILWHQTILPGLVRRLRLDVLHIPSYRRLLWSRPCPLVATIHDLAPFHLRKKYSWSRMFYGRVIVPRLARRQDQIVAISENTARDIGRFFGVSPERMTVIHNGVDHRRFFPGDRAPAKHACARRFGLDRPFFLYIARLEHPAKNHVPLIEAFNRFKASTDSPWLLALAGADWHGAGRIHAAVEASPFARDIRRLGFVSDDFVPDLYRAADLFVYPSLFEGFGMPPVEAMACGCPVLSSSRGSLGEVLGNAAAILLQPDDVQALAAGLSRLAGDTALRQRLTAAGIAQAQTFNWAGTAKGITNVYERAVKTASAIPSLAY